MTLLFDHAQYEAAAEAYMAGIERRIEQGLDPAIGSVASVFISRWDVAVAGQVPDELKDRLGILAAAQCYVAYRELYESDRWQRLENEGAPQAAAALGHDRDQGSRRSRTRCTSSALAAPDTINTMPEETLLAFADHGEVAGPASADGGDADAGAGRSFAEAGIDLDALGAASYSRRARRSSSTAGSDLLALHRSRRARSWRA